MSYMVGREDKRTNNRTMFPALKINATAGYQGPVKIDLLKGAGLLRSYPVSSGLSYKSIDGILSYDFSTENLVLAISMTAAE